MSVLIAAKQLTVHLGEKQILDNVDLALEAGEIVTIVGPNGSGKTTLVRALLGSIKPSKGNVERGKGLRLGYVPQKLAVDRSLPLSVRRFLTLPGKQSRADIDQALEQAGVAEAKDQPLAGLSGGQFQRVLLARALLTKPTLLLLDEATQGLDQPGSAAFYRQVEQVRNDLGCAVLMVSHELHVVMSASDRVICLNRHICCHGTPEVVAAAPAYRELFGTGSGGALALYRHEHDHHHHAHTDDEHRHGSCDHD